MPFTFAKKLHQTLLTLVVTSLSLWLINLKVITIDDGCISTQQSPFRTDEQILFCPDEEPDLPARCGGEQRKSPSKVIFKDPPPSEPFEACFISSVFFVSETQSDKVSDARPWKEKYPNYGFFMYTNLVNMETPGWRKVLHFDRTFKRMITVSRYPKFLAWKDDVIQDYCPVVYYMDASSRPKALLEGFRAQTQRILQSNVGLSQIRHYWDLKKEMQMILSLSKDVKPNMEATRKWMEAKPDFTYDCQLYQNTFFGRQKDMHAAHLKTVPCFSRAVTTHRWLLLF